VKKWTVLFLTIAFAGIILWSCSDGGNPAGSETEKYIKVTSPNGGENWIKGLTQTIIWTDNISEDVRIDLYKGGVFLSNISNSVLSLGTYNWAISDTLQGDPDYKIRITSTADESLSDVSDDNFILSKQPLISTNPTSLSYGSVEVGETSSEQTFTLTGSDLTANITVTAPADFQVSATSGSGFASSINFTPSSGNVNSTVYVRFSPTDQQSYTGNVICASTSATTVNVAVSGTGFIYTPGEMAFVQGGTFTMGDHFSEGLSSELPLHSVTVSDFYMEATEVTQAEWSAYMPAESWSSTYGVGDTYPAYYVSWYEIIKYCNLRSIAEGLTPCYMISSSTNPSDWGSVPTSTNTAWDVAICNWSANGYRLPTEAEWEYAARGGTHNTDDYRYSGCHEEADLTNYAWYSSNSESTSHPVGTKLPNQLGLYDMTGNLWEWCWDWDGTYTSDEQTNPTGPTTGSKRVIRGGYWGNPAYPCCRVAFRYLFLPYGSYPDFGFRLTRTP